MSFKDSFDAMIVEIEKLVKYDDDHGWYKAYEIIELLRKKEGKTARDLNTIFEYISGQSLNRYVKDRKMMATYVKMLEDKDYKIQEYVECSGYDNESSFSTAFSKEFGVTPKKAYLQKDKTKIIAPLSMDALLGGPDLPVENVAISDKVYGLAKDVIDRYNEICEYQAVFGFEDKFIDLVVFLNDEKGVNLLDACKVVDALKTDYEDVSNSESMEEMLNFINKTVPVVYIKHLYPDVCLPELNYWYSRMKEEGGNLLNETPEFVHMYFDNVSSDFAYKDLKALYKKYLNRYKDRYTFYDFLVKIQTFGSIEAFDESCDELRKLYQGEEDESIEIAKQEDLFWTEFDEKHFRNM